MDNKVLRKISAVLLLIASIIWGMGFVASGVILDLGFTPTQLIAGRMTIASILLNIFFFKRLKTISKGEVKAGAVIGAYLLSAFIFQTFGLKHSTPSINAFVTAIYVILIPFIKFLITKEKLDIFSNVSAILTVVGIGLISLTGGADVSFGAILTLISAVLYALQFIAIEKYTKESDPINITIVMINFCAIVSLTISGVSAIIYKNIPQITSNGLLAFLFLGFAGTFICFLIQNIGQKYTPATQVAVLLSLEAVFGSMFSAIVYKEAFNTQMIIGSILIFIAIIISETKLEFLLKDKNTQTF